MPLIGKRKNNKTIAKVELKANKRSMVGEIRPHELHAMEHVPID